MFIDAHVHLDRYAELGGVLAEAAAAHVICIAMTETPRDFEVLMSRVGGHARVRVALGAHPLCAERLDEGQLRRFDELVSNVDYVGEVGLDGSGIGRASLDAQRRVFARVLGSPGLHERVLSVHSRGAEAETVAALADAGALAVLHWYSGALKHAARALEAGLYFSVNPAMLRSQRGARLLRSLPRDRVLSETDGPFVTIGARRARPADVPALVGSLAAAWSCELEEARVQVWQNMAALHAQAAAGRGRDMQTRARSASRPEPDQLPRPAS